RNYSEEIAAMVDDEVKTLISGAHQEAFDILVDNRDVLDDLVIQLFEKETLDQHEVAAVFASLRRRDRRPAWTGSPQRVPSDRPPVNPPPSTNGSRPEAEQGGVVLAPGEGGDIHSGGGSGGSVPTPGGGEGLGSDAALPPPPPVLPERDPGQG
ncbi:MAG TPA: cell division protein FtsH, partial [Nocardioidaceae bacterium]|nr:cell division protein FtsH [Nocardioidaceae bacterium]